MLIIIIVIIIKNDALSTVRLSGHTMCFLVYFQAPRVILKRNSFHEFLRYAYIILKNLYRTLILVLQSKVATIVKSLLIFSIFRGPVILPSCWLRP